MNVKLIRTDTVNKILRREVTLPSRETVQKMIPRVLVFGLALGLGLLAHAQIIIRLNAATAVSCMHVAVPETLRVIVDEQGRWFVIEKKAITSLSRGVEIHHYNQLADLEAELKKSDSLYAERRECRRVEISDLFSFNQKNQNAALVQAKDVFHRNGFQNVQIRAVYSRSSSQRAWEFLENSF